MEHDAPPAPEEADLAGTGATGLAGAWGADLAGRALTALARAAGSDRGATGRGLDGARAARTGL
jgi:hypothetical protein